MVINFWEGLKLNEYYLFVSCWCCNLLLLDSKEPAILEERKTGRQEHQAERESSRLTGGQVDGKAADRQTGRVVGRKTGRAGFHTRGHHCWISSLKSSKGLRLQSLANGNKSATGDSQHMAWYAEVSDSWFFHLYQALLQPYCLESKPFFTLNTCKK